MHRRTKAKAWRYGIYAATLAVILVVVLKADWGKLQEAFFDPKIFADQFPKIITQAARNTLIFTFFGFTGGLALGLLLALMRLSSIKPYRWAASTYIEIFRGLPALITIILIGFVVGVLARFVKPGNDGMGLILTAVLGICGAVLATWFGQALHWYAPGQPAGFLGSVLGAIVILVVVSLFRRRRR